MGKIAEVFGVIGVVAAVTAAIAEIVKDEFKCSKCNLEYKKTELHKISIKDALTVDENFIEYFLKQNNIDVGDYNHKCKLCKNCYHTFMKKINKINEFENSYQRCKEHIITYPATYLGKIPDFSLQENYITDKYKTKSLALEEMKRHAFKQKKNLIYDISYSFEEKHDGNYIYRVWYANGSIANIK